MIAQKLFGCACRKKPECGLQVRIPVRMKLLLQGAQEIQDVLFLCGSERVEVCNNRISL